MNDSASTTSLSSDTALARSFPRAPVLRLLAGLVLLVSLVVAVVVVVQQVQTTAALETHTHQLLQDIIDETRENASGFLVQAQSAVELTQGLFDSRLLSIDRTGELEAYFLQQLQVLPQVDAVYFGDRRGRFVFTKRDDERPGGFVTKFIEVEQDNRRVYRIWRDRGRGVLSRADDPDDNYDPRLRPWYDRAQAAAGAVWTDPYVFFTSRRPGLTVAARVHDEAGRLLGVVGADVELHALSAFLTGQTMGAMDAAFILHRNGNVLAFPDPELLPQPDDGDRFRLATLGELGDIAAAAAAHLRRDVPDLAGVEQAHFASFEARGERFRLVFAPFLESERWPWLMGVYAPEEQFATAIRRAQRQSVVLAVVIGVLMASAMFLLGPLLLGSYRALQREAYLDPLTTLLNRRGFLTGAAQELQQTGAGRAALAAIMIDIDRFKLINDSYGHQVGDQVLVAVAGRLRCELPSGDLLARYGGEEFAVLAPATTADEAQQVAERLRTAVRGTPVHTSAGPLQVTVSLGVAASSLHDGDLQGLLHRADTGLLRAKRSGRDRVVAMPPG